MADLDHYHALEDEKEEEIKKVRSALYIHGHMFKQCHVASHRLD